jgi:hypothetical protein
MGLTTPFLIILYFIQAILYQRYAPVHLSSDMNVFLGIGLGIIIFCYHFYDYHHRVLFHRNYLEVRFDLLKMKKEILYQSIEQVEVSKSRKHYGDVKIYLRDGQIIQLHNVDQPHEVKNYLVNQLRK